MMRLGWPADAELNVFRTHFQRMYSLSTDRGAADGEGQGKARQGKERQKETYLAGIMLCLDKLFKRNDINDKVISLLNGIPFKCIGGYGYVLPPPRTVFVVLQ